MDTRGKLTLMLTLALAACDASTHTPATGDAVDAASASEPDDTTVRALACQAFSRVFCDVRRACEDPWAVAPSCETDGLWQCDGALPAHPDLEAILACVDDLPEGDCVTTIPGCAAAGLPSHR